MNLVIFDGRNVRVTEIGSQRTVFEPPRFSSIELQAEISRRRARARAIREQNRMTQGAV